MCWSRSRARKSISVALVARHTALCSIRSETCALQPIPVNKYLHFTSVIVRIASQTVYTPSAFRIVRGRRETSRKSSVRINCIYIYTVIHHYREWWWQVEIVLTVINNSISSRVFVDPVFYSALHFRVSSTGLTRTPVW